MPSRDDFRNYQQRTVEFIKNNEACAAWVFMGGGKTVSTLTAYDDLRAAKQVKRVLVVAPLRVARDVWHVEAVKWPHLRHLRVSRILGDRGQRLAALRRNADVYTINRENVKWLHDLFVKREGRKWKQTSAWPFDMVVLDESSSFKAQSSGRWKAMKRLRRMFPRLVELTGTPAPNRLPDLWAQMYLIDKGARLGHTETAYRQRWFVPPGPNQLKWTAKPKAYEQICQAVSDVVLSLNESDYMDLPPVLPHYVKVRMTPAAEKIYRRFEKTSIMQAGDAVVSAISAGVLHNKLCQLANGAVYTDGKAYEVFHDEKLYALVELLDEAEGPVLVAYNYRSDLERIQKRLADEYGDERVVAVLDSEASVAAWNRGEIDVLLLHPDSAGHGLNLQDSGSERIVWFGLTANLEHVQQLNARLAGGHRRRGGLVISYIVTEGTVDEKLIGMIDEKAKEQDNLRRGVAALSDDWLWL